MAADEHSPSGTPSAADYSTENADFGDDDVRQEDPRWERFAAHNPGASAVEQDHPGMLHGFLDEQLRVRPLSTLIAAVALGWVVGKLLR